MDNGNKIHNYVFAIDYNFDFYLPMSQYSLGFMTNKLNELVILVIILKLTARSREHHIDAH